MVSRVVPQRRIVQVLYWAAPPLLCLLIYWPAFLSWFQDDDFAHLGLLGRVYNWGDLFHVLFTPTQHGTWRPLSERAYYLALNALFGADSALPFHIVSFLTQFANMALLAAITLRLTASRLAGFLAPILWITNSKLILIMAWSPNYDYILCAFLMLSAFWLLLRFFDTGERRYYVGMWIAFLLGFGALETNLVFPLIASAYAWLRARDRFRTTWPLWAPSIAFVTVNRWLIHGQAAGPYKPHFTTAMVGTLAHYWMFAFEPVNLTAFTGLPEAVGTVGAVILTVALLGFVAYSAYRRNMLPAFFLAWFGIVMLPFLPFRDNVQDYYLDLPIIGIAMLGAYAFAQAWKSTTALKLTAAVLLAFFLLESVPTARGGSSFYFNRAEEVRNLMQSVIVASSASPGKSILLTGIDASLFDASIGQGALRAYGLDRVFVAPGDLPSGDALVLEWQAGRLADITRTYVRPATRSRVDAADPASASQLGPTWYAVDPGGFRWMPKSAEVRLKGPAVAGERLYISGYCPAAQVVKGPLHLTVTQDGTVLGTADIAKGNAPFHLEWPLRASQSNEIAISLEVDRTFHTAPDKRELGLAFGVIENR